MKNKFTFFINLSHMTLFVFISFFIVTGNAFAAPFSERHAFCTDRMNLAFSNHENTKIYNACMENADALIKEHEEATRELQKAVTDMHAEEGKRMASDNIRIDWYAECEEKYKYKLKKTQQDEWCWRMCTCLKPLVRGTSYVQDGHYRDAQCSGIGIERYGASASQAKEMKERNIVCEQCGLKSVKVKDQWGRMIPRCSK